MTDGQILIAASVKCLWLAGCFAAGALYVYVIKPLKGEGE